MEDWQGCLSPCCQAALLSARDDVVRRGGYAITIEDFLLAMLDEVPQLVRFLQRQGVDLDELTRTIQCEQPIVTAVTSDNLLSSQVIYWLDCARQRTGAAWLNWPILLETLVQSAERLKEKAYVAVLELVGRWPSEPPAPMDELSERSEPCRPTVIADPGWASLLDDVSVRLSSRAAGLIWLIGTSGSGKSSWLASVIASLPGGAVEVDIRREADVMASDQTALGQEAGLSIPPTLVLDNVSPADLQRLMCTEHSVVRALVTSWPGPILLLSADSPEAQAAIKAIQSHLGRKMDRVQMVSASVVQKRAILTAHQPMIEKRWSIELAPGVISFVAACDSPAVDTPGAMLQWLEAAAARLHLFAQRGPHQAQALIGQIDSLRRQSLLALARQEPAETLESSLQSLTLELSAIESAWHERKKTGCLRLLTADDLRHELNRRVAEARRPGHYVTESKRHWGPELARPGNLYP